MCKDKVPSFEVNISNCDMKLHYVQPIWMLQSGDIAIFPKVKIPIVPIFEYDTKLTTKLILHNKITQWDGILDSLIIGIENA